MSTAAVVVEGVGKRYPIAEAKGYSTVRDALTNGVRKIVRRLGSPKDQSKSASATFWALRDVSFDVKPGDTLGILGRNGAGKSTLLKILSRVTAPTSGKARVRGRLGSLLEIGTGFHPELSGRDNIQLNGAILGMSRAEINRHFDEIVAFAEIEKFLEMPVKHYSSGMYMRLAFAVAAHLDPEILVIDEVLAVGDSAFQKKCLRKMSSVAKEGRTILFVSHNMAAVSSLCNKGLLLENGSMVCAGPITDVVNRYSRSGALLQDTHWKGDHGDENVRLRETWVRSLDPSEAFDTSADIEVGIQIQVLRRLEGLVFGFRLLSQYDYELAYMLYDDREPPPAPAVEPGEMIKRFIIPANTLAEGSYTIGVSVGIHNLKPIVLFSDQGSVTFELDNLRGRGRRFPTRSERGYTSLFRPSWEVR